jgi:hypothetical protein
MVNLTDYYHFAAREPFVYRVLPALLYHLITFGRPDLLTGMNDPFSSSYSIFQLLIDALSLGVALVFMEKIAQVLNPSMPRGVTRTFAAAAALVIVVFGYYMVPNRALFYPYDYPDMCFATVVFYLCIRLQGRAEFLLAIAIMIATFNKETAVFYSGLYVAVRAGRDGRDADWFKISCVVAACAVGFIIARSVVMELVRSHATHVVPGSQQYEFHLAYTLEQLKNPLFVFAMLNVCSYLYVPIFLLRRKLDRTDYLILLMIAGWTAIMAVVGIVRELRIFVPASLMMFVILARHLDEIVKTLAPGMLQQQLQESPAQPQVPHAAAGVITSLRRRMTR